MLRAMDLVHPLIVAGLILHRRAYALIAVAIVFLPFRGDESLLRRIRETRGVLRPESLLSRHRAASGWRGNHIAVLGDADGNIADVHRNLTALGVAQGLRQCPDVVVCEAKRLNLRELRILGKGRQGHPQTFESVVQSVHSVTLAIVRLYPPVPL